MIPRGIDKIPKLKDRDLVSLSLFNSLDEGLCNHCTPAL